MHQYFYRQDTLSVTPTNSVKALKETRGKALIPSRETEATINWFLSKGYCYIIAVQHEYMWSWSIYLERKRENYQVCSVQYCVQQLYTVNCTHMWTELTVLWIGFCLTGPISLCLDSLLCMYYFMSDCIYIACMCSMLTWWGGPGGIEAWSLGPPLSSVLWHCWLGHLTRKTRPLYDI